MGGTDFFFSLETNCAVVNGYKMNILMEILVINCNTYEKVRSKTKKMYNTLMTDEKCE